MLAPRCLALQHQLQQAASAAACRLLLLLV
jgi:hypothetical protein